MVTISLAEEPIPGITLENWIGLYDGSEQRTNLAWPFITELELLNSEQSSRYRVPKSLERITLEDAFEKDSAAVLRVKKTWKQGMKPKAIISIDRLRESGGQFSLDFFEPMLYNGLRGNASAVPYACDALPALSYLATAMVLVGDLRQVSVGSPGNEKRYLVMDLGMGYDKKKPIKKVGVSIESLVNIFDPLRSVESRGKKYGCAETRAATIRRPLVLAQPYANLMTLLGYRAKKTKKDPIQTYYEKRIDGTFATLGLQFLSNLAKWHSQGQLSREDSLHAQSAFSTYSRALFELGYFADNNAIRLPFFVNGGCANEILSLSTYALNNSGLNVSASGKRISSNHLSSVEISIGNYDFSSQRHPLLAVLGEELANRTLQEVH